MSRAQRLLKLMDLLHQYRFPVAGGELAAALGISLRTLYRDIASLQAQGARIEGEAGLGYVLRPGFVLPPLMFDVEEVEALVLGARWVAEHGDEGLCEAARRALSRIAAVLPPPLRTTLEDTSLLVGPAAVDDRGAGSRQAGGSPPDIGVMRGAIRSGCKVRIVYEDAQGVVSGAVPGREGACGAAHGAEHGEAHGDEHGAGPGGVAVPQRIIWPFALGYFERVRVLVAWCELRQDFRHFRVDRMRRFEVLEMRYPARRQALLARWREQMGIPPDWPRVRHKPGEGG